MGENQSIPIPDVFQNNKAELKDTASNVSGADSNLKNIVEELDKLFMNMVLTTYIPSQDKDTCNELKEKIFTLFNNIPKELLQKLAKKKIMDIDEYKKSDIDTMNVPICEMFADFYTVLYHTMQDILKVLSPHYVYKKENESLKPVFAIYHDKNRKFLEELKEQKIEGKTIDMNPCKQRLLMYYYNSKKNANTIEFGIRNPHIKHMDIDRKDYGIQALKDLYKDKYNPVTKTFEDSSYDMKELLRLHMKDIQEDNVRLGKTIQVEFDTNETNETLLDIKEKFNAYVSSVDDIHKHYERHIQLLHTIIKQIVTIKDTPTLQEFITYKDILKYRKEVTDIVKTLYETCDELSGIAMNKYDDLYNFIETYTSEFKVQNLNKQIENYTYIKL